MGLWTRTLVLFIINALANVYAVEEFVVVHAPESVRFLSEEPVHSSNLGDILSAMLAYTVPSSTKWNSLAVVSPWKRPEAIVVLEMLGFGSGVDMPVEGSHFLLENAGNINKQFDLLSGRTSERFLEKRPVLLRMDLSEELQDSKIVQPLLLKSLPANPDERLSMALDDADLGSLIRDSTFNVSRTSDIRLLIEIATVKEFLRALNGLKSAVRDNIPDVYWLKMSGLEPIVAAYGTESLQFREAVRLLHQIISEVDTVMRKVYDGEVIVAIMKVDEVPPLLGYKNRKLLEAAEDMTSELKYNLALMWDPAFPVTFAILAFVVITMALAILGISIAMWFMDPGKDSIIYRSSKRMKKD